MEHLRQGTDVLTIAKLVGHSRVDTTMGYTKFSYDDVERGALNHPFFTRILSKDKILNRLDEETEKWSSLYKNRASFEKTRNGNSLSVKITIQ